MIQTAEAITQIPTAQVEIVEKQIPKVQTQAIEKIVEVPQVLVEEQLVEVPQVQTAEIIRQVQKTVIQPVQKGIPKISTQVVEVVQAVPALLTNEIAQEVPQVQMVEVFKQTANATAQRIVQTGIQYERAVGREVIERVEQGTMAGIYDAGIVGVRENVSVQPTVVERVSPVMTMGEVETFVAPTGIVETVVPTYGGAVEYVTAAPTEYITAAPTYYEGVAPTTYIEGGVVAPTMMEVAPTQVMEIVG